MTLHRELLLLQRDRAVIGAVLLLSAACVLAVANGVRWHATQHTAQVRALQNQQAEYEARRATVVEYQIRPPLPLDPVLNNLHNPLSPYVVGQAGRIAYLPLPSTAALAIGQFDLLPLQELVSIRTRQRTVADKDGLENPLQLAAGRFDLSFVVVFLLPLFTLALTYNLVALEREEGTFGLLRCQADSMGRLMLTRTLLRALPLALICSIAAWAGSAAAEPARLTLFTIVVFAYTLFWAALAFRVNSRERSSTGNAAILTLCWVLAVAILPAAVHLAVGSARPVPSRLELLDVVRDRSIDARRDAKGLVAEWYARNPQWLPPPQSGPLYDVATGGTLTHIEQDRRTLPVEARFDAALAARQQLVSLLRFTSPAIATAEALLDASGTSLARYADYKGQVRAFRESWLAHFYPRIFRKQTLTPSDYDQFPAFSYREPQITDSATLAACSSAALLAAALWLCRGALRRLS